MASLNLNFNTLDSISKPGGRPLDFAFSASIVVVGAGGGGAASGTSLPPAGGGGAGSIKTLNVKIVPNLTYTVNQIGVSGSGGINATGQNAGGNGTLTQLTYWKGPTDTTGTDVLIASGGFGANLSGSGGASGDGFTGGAVSGNMGGGGAGTFENGSSGVGNNGGNGGNYLGGGGGANGTVITAGGVGRSSIQITVAGTDSVLYTVSGSGGTGGSRDGANTIDPTNGLYGGGGGGASYQLSTSRPGAGGGQGVVVVTYSGQPKMLVTNGYTNYIPSSNITAHYITGSNGTFIFPYPYPWSDVTGSLVG